MKLLSFLILLSLSLCSYAQEGSIKRLEERNGYAGIRLGDSIVNLKISTIPLAGYSSKDKFGASWYYLANDSLLNINDEKVFDDIIINCLDDKISSIVLHYYPNKIDLVKTALRTAYGAPTVSDTKLKNEGEFWNSKSITLFLSLKPLNNKYEIIFSSPTLTELFEKRVLENNKKASSAF